MLKNIITFGDVKVSEVMIPRTDIVGIDVHCSVTELKKIFINEEHARIPVYEETMDEIRGFIHIKDFIRYIGNKKKFIIDDIIRDIIFVPKSMKIADLLAKMRKQSLHIAIVLDEYGGTEGLVTIEDLVEEIVGDIRDEHDREDEQAFVKVAAGIYKVEGRADVELLEEEMGITLSDSNSSDFETFGGFIISYMGCIPKVGQKIKHPSGLKIEITEADQRKIISAMVEVPIKKK